MAIFFLLNGLGMGFLLYVLVNFWQEGHRRKNASRRRATVFGRREGTDVVVITHPISHNACGGLSVTPLRVRGFDQSLEEEYRRFVSQLDEMPIDTRMKSKRLSTT